MISKTSLHQQQGVVLVLVALTLIVLMGVAALAIDLSHAEVNKTRLQNLVDALALSAAISLNKKEVGTTNPADAEVYAEDYAKTNTLPAFKASSGNSEISSVAANFTFKFATTLSNNQADWKAANAIQNAKFVRVTMTNMNVATWFAPVLNLISGGNFSSVPVSNSAVAGTAPVNPCDNVLPIMMCAETNDPSQTADANGNKIDKNCNDNSITGNGTNTNNDCYGYERDVVYESKESNWKSNSIGPGNFGFFDVGSGGAAIKDCLAGLPTCTDALCPLLNSGATIVSKPGNTVGPAEQGLNTRFDLYKGSIKYSDCDINSQNYPAYCPDSIVNHSLSSTGRTPGQEFITVSTPDNVYNSYYKDHYQSSNDLTSGHTLYFPSRRLVVMPFVKCTNDGNGATPMPVVGYGCWFLTSTSDGKSIYAEFLGTDGCNIAGTPTSTNNFGFYKVQLYKDPFGGHS